MKPFLALLHRTLQSAIGTVSWQPPRWWSNKTPSTSPQLRLWLGGIGAVILLTLAVAGIAKWWTDAHPQSGLTGVTVAAPPVSLVVDGKIVPCPLSVKFSQSAAMLDQIGKKVLRGIELQPALPGTWTWSSDRELSFRPETDWPAGKTFTVRLDRTLFPGHVQLDTYRPRFTTEAFAVHCETFEFYVNPTSPAEHRATATLQFTHPVDAAALTKSLAWKWQTREDFFERNGKNDAPITVTLAPGNRTAYVRSLPIRLPKEAVSLQLLLPARFSNLTGDATLNAPLSAELLVPDLYSFLHINSACTVIANRADGEPEQALMIETAIGVKTDDLKKQVAVYLLPADKPARGSRPAEKNFDWSSAGELDDSLLAQAKRIELKWNPGEVEFPTVHSARFVAPEGRHLLVQIPSGLTGLGGFVMKDDYRSIVRVAPYPKEVRLLHDGALLALNGERKLTVLARSLRQVEYRIGRIDPKEINHLVSQSSGNFQSPIFNSYHFGEDNLCDVITKKIDLSTEPGKASYLTLNFNDYLTDRRTGEHRGLFLVRIAEIKPSNENSEETSDDPSTHTMEDNRSADNRWEDRDNSDLASDRRLILVTDLGIVAKQNADSSQDVFVQSIQSGQPVGGARVDVLGKNGVPVTSATTDSAGRASLPVLKDFKREQEPVALVVRRGEDFSFMPYGRADRRLNFSRYDISGLELSRPDVLDALIFSDRGVYRPGETARFGIALKQMDWKGQLAGLPLEMAVTDPQGRECFSASVKATAGGFFEWSYATREAAPTGLYSIGLYVKKNDKRGDLVGSTTIRVEEFLPDRLKIRTSLTDSTHNGWVRPDDLKIAVELANLYGAPAAGHRITGKLSLTPAEISFPAYADYSFFDPMLKDATKREAHDEELAESVTNDLGRATLDLNLSRFDSAAYRLTYVARGFEKEGGRSVATGGSALVSARSWLVGFKADGDMKFIARNAKREVKFLAVDAQLKPFAAGELKLVVSEQYYLSVLTKKNNGNYAYQSVLKERKVKSETLRLSPTDTVWTVPTTTPGDYLARLYDTQNVCVSVVRYSVVGSGNASRQLERNAELKAQLSKTEFAPGEEISIALTAPYTGSGLITIERDRVYAHRWFRANSVSSVQKITLPSDFEGNGYINVAFVRALDSREIFMSPLSYAVIPFRVNRAKRTVHVELSAPEKIKPGETLSIHYKSDKPSRIIVYAVDEGILQVAGYQLPNPLDHFLQKRALQVSTDQILDLILPEYSISREVASAGGDGREDLLAANLNPFKRKNEAPVAFWSGILECSSTLREVRYTVPDYFNGSLRLMAVAVSDSAAGAAEKSVTARGSFIVQPNAPTFAAPGDVFDVSVTVANQQEGSGANAKVDFAVTPSSGIEIMQSPASSLTIPEGRDSVVHFRCRAKDQLGNADLNFTVRRGETIVRYASHLSIRPASPYRTQVLSGSFSGSTKELPMPGDFYSAYYKGNVTVAASPLALVRGLQTYLDDYPHLCSEQLTSCALPLICLIGEKEIGTSREAATSKFREIATILRGRQNDEGAFGLWRTDKVEPFHYTSVHVMNLLTEAKERDFPVMSDMFDEGLSYLQKMAEGKPESLSQARAQAWAIYLLTRNEVVATNALNRLRERLEQNYPDRWKNDLAAVYCAAAYAQLHQTREAERLIDSFQMGVSPTTTTSYDDFYSQLDRDAQYLTIIARHFPERLKKISARDWESILRPVMDSTYNTHSAAYTILALTTCAQSGQLDHVAIETKSVNEAYHSLSTDGNLVRTAMLTSDLRHLKLSIDRANGAATTPVYYQITQSGFDHTPTDKALAQGLEITREFRNANGDVVTRAKLGEELEVHLRIRTTERETVGNVAIVDLLPAGFEVAPDSLRGAEYVLIKYGRSSRWELMPIDSVDAREDRVVIYGWAYRTAREFIYRVKAVSCGEFTVPATQAQSMYQPELTAHNVANRFTVEAK